MLVIVLNYTETSFGLFIICFFVETYLDHHIDRPEGIHIMHVTFQTCEFEKKLSNLSIYK